MDIDNLTNLLNHDWGVSQRLVGGSRINQPLTSTAVDANGACGTACAWSTAR